jgi:hypothetical protein
VIFMDARLAAQLAVHRPQRQTLLVDGALRAVVGQVHRAADVALRVQARRHRQVQVGRRQRRVEEARIDVLRVQREGLQRDLGKRRQHQVRRALGARRLAAGVEHRLLQVAASVQGQLRGDGAGL